MSHKRFMDRALALARCALDEGEAPIGTVVVLDGEIVAEAYWRGLQAGRLGHPELVALLDADAALRKRDGEAALYTTLEPCLMCMGAAMSAFLDTIVYAVDSPLDGAARVATEWAPPAGHPRPGERAAYRVPHVVGGGGREYAGEVDYRGACRR